MASVAFEGVGKQFPDGTRAIEHLDLVVDDGSFVVLVGPSGCGKSTALRLVAGLEHATDGRVLIDSQPVDAMPPGERDVAMVFQNYALYPHMSVADNIAFGLRAHGVPRQERQGRAVEIASVLGLEDLLTRKPKALSGGQRQRVAMGRAIAREPRVFLMDEPLSNLDAQLRVQMRGEIVRIQREVGITALYVTHDQVEAMTMGTKVAVMNAGRLMQFDAPKALYDAPTNAFVARFIGNPPMNILPGELRETETGPAFQVGDQRAALPPRVLGVPGLRDRLGGPVLLGVRPDDVRLAGTGADHGVRLRCTVVLSEVLGSEVIVYLEVAEHSSGPATRTRLAGKFPEGAGARPGDSIEVDLAASGLRFFDAATEDALGTTVADGAGIAAA
jgi:multiple sugar transport system ATP-binding protein